ncbi:MAG TPA: cyclic nucleotide-binding domain-containing protein, partial [Elusimicrobiales bacterium]|nr:cyclic nucleotide-binding domain-containing protein [Elusimicrobiales bacterium]
MANPRDKKQDSMLLSGLPPELAEEIKRTDYKQGDVIFEEGDPGDKLYVVAYGEVRIEKKLDQKSGKMKTLAVCFEEDFFGEMAVLEREKRFARAVAQTDAGLLELSADAFARLSKLKPEATVRFFLKLSRGISGKLRDTSGQLLVLYTMGRLLLEKYRGEKEFLAKLAAELNEGLGEGWSCSAYHYNVFNEELDTAFGGQPPDGLAGEKEDRWL